MESEYAQPQKQNINKGTYVTMKRAPGQKVHTVPITTKIRRERQAQARQQQQEHAVELEKLRREAMKTVKTTEKKRNTWHAQKRVTEKQSQYRYFVKVPANVSPILNLKIGDSNNEQRLVSYTRKHKCAHGNAYTSIRQYNNVRQDGTSEPMYLEPVCHCDTERCTGKYEEMQCGNCTRNVLEVIKDQTFPGDIRRCTFCKLQWYRIISWSRERALDIIAMLPPKRPKTTQKMWAPLPKVEALNLREETQKEFGEGIQNYLLEMLTKGKEMVNGILAWIAKSCADQIIRKAITKTWEGIQSFFLNALDVITNRPFHFGYHFYQMMMTESTVERLVVMSLIAADLGLTQSLERVACLFGCNNSNWVPTFMARRVNREEQEEEARARAKDTKVHYNKDGTIRLQPPDEPKREPTQSESGETLLEHLFQFSKWLPKIGLNLIKDFNTMMTGWKNLHELVNNLLDKLPNWLTRLFTITDPRKRYGVESKTPGNPVYDMIQSYLELLTGENCASPRQYDEFLRLWKEADIYINREYQANDFVKRLHVSYRMNATALMKPQTRGSRPIPFVVTLRGKPGKGKSSTWPALFAKVTGGTMHDIRAMSYTRNPSSDFFDGYVPQKHKIFLYDDFAYKVDDESAAEFMSIVSNADYLPPYASLNDPNVGVKGTSFDSPIVVLCSNFESFEHCKQIADKVALKRRLGIVISWNQKWQPGVKYEVFRTETDGTQTPLVKFENNVMTNEYTLPEIQDLLAREYDRHMADQRSRDDIFDTMMNFNVDRNAFLDKYHQALAPERRPDYFETPDVSDTEECEKETGPLTALSLVTLTYQLADLVDRKLHGWGSILLSVAATAAAAFLMMKYLFGHDKTNTESGEGHQPKAASKPPMFSRMTRQPAEKEVGNQNDEGTIRRVTNNHVMLVDEKMRFVSGIFVSGRIFLTVKHFVKQAKQLTLHTHRSTDSEMFEIEMKDAKVVEIPDADLALVECPIYVQPFTDISRYFCDTPVTKDVPGYVTRRNHQNDLVVYGTTIKKSRTISVYTHADGSTTEQVCDVQYDFEHQSGDCGNVVFASQGGSLKIVGMHESGSMVDRKKSFAATLHRAELERLLRQFKPISLQEEFPYEEIDLEDGKGFNKTMFVGYSNQHITSSAKTDLVKSELHDVIRTHTTEPALLYKKGDLDPMTRALNKYGLSTKQFPVHVAEQAAQALEEELKSHVDGDNFEPLTVHEALNGIPGEVDSVDLTTSSGYPFSLDPKLRGAKRKVIDGEPGNLTLSKIAQDHYESWGTLIQNKQIPSDPFIATLKDEPRPIEKVRLGKTRVFCAGSLTSFIWNKRFFARFGVFLKRIRGKSFSTIGLNRGSREWHEMISYLREVGEYGLGGDQEEWDGRFKSHLALLAYRIISAVSNFNEEAQLIGMILFLHAVFPHLRITWRFGEDLVTVIVRILGCMPSGWFLTLIVNSLVNALLFRIAWILLVSAPFNDAKYFRDFTREKYTGDDNFLAVATAFLEEFNNITIAECLAIYGQKYTPASKRGELVPFEPIEEITFLKTKTGILFDQYVPHFDMDANFSTLNWTRKSDDNFSATESNCNDVLRNLFFYGEKEFTKWRDMILLAAPRMNLINFYSLETAYLGYGAIPDPYGTYGFTKSKTKNPAAFYRAVQQTLATKSSQNLQREVSVKESGQFLNKMNLSQRANELKQQQRASAQKYLEYLASYTDIAETYLEQTSKAIENSPLAEVYALAKGDATRTEILKLQLKTSELGRVAAVTNESLQKLRSFLARARVIAAKIDEVRVGIQDPDDLELFNAFVAQNKYNRLDDLATARSLELTRKLMQKEWDDNHPKREPAQKESGRVEQPVHMASTTPATEVGSISNIDDSTPKITSKVGVHLAEQQQTVMREGTDGAAKEMPSRSDGHLNEISWDLQMMLERFNLVSAFQWALTDAPGTELAIGAPVTDVPADLLKNNISATPFERFVWWRCKKIKVRFQLVASRFHQGRALVYFVPSCLPKTEQAAVVRGPTRATQLQHGFLDPANGTVLDFEIPFVFHKGFLDLVFGDSLGQLHFQILNKLQAATGASTSVEVKVFVSFEGSHFRVPREGGVTFETMLLRQQAKRLGFNVVEREEAVKESGVFEGLGQNLGKEADNLLNSLIPKEITGAVAGVLLDKPAVTEYPEPLVHKDAQYMSSSRGIEKLERMTLEPSAQNLTSDQFGSEQDEMDIKYLLKKKIYYTQLNWV